MLPTVSSVTSMPSNWTRVPVPPRPDMPTVRNALTLVGSIAPPSRTITPGSSRASSRKLRALSGNLSICSPRITPSTVWRVVSTCTSVFAATVTTSCAPPALSELLALTTCPTRRGTFSSISVLNPFCSILTLYSPGRRARASYDPSALVVSEICIKFCRCSKFLFYRKVRWAVDVLRLS